MIVDVKVAIHHDLVAVCVRWQGWGTDISQAVQHLQSQWCAFWITSLAEQVQCGTVCNHGRYICLPRVHWHFVYLLTCEKGIYTLNQLAVCMPSSNTLEGFSLVKPAIYTASL